MTMKLATMLSDVIPSLFSKPVTVNFPTERQQTPDHLRGLLAWDAEKCNGCGLCAKDCPALALDVIVLDKATKRFVVRYHVDRCTFCAQCVESCNRDALAMSPADWELAASDKHSLEKLYGSQADIDAVLGGIAVAGAEPTG